MQRDETPRPAAATSAVLRGVMEAHEAFHRGDTPRHIFSSLLDVIFTLTGSASGYIGELIDRPEGRTIRLMVSSQEFDVIGSIPVAEAGPDLYRLMTAPIRENRPVVVDRTTLAGSHPDVVAHLPEFGRFVGIPTEGSGRVNGVVGFLDPISGDVEPDTFRVLADTCGLLIAAYRAARERHEIEAMLERRERTLEAILGTAGVGIVTVDRVGRLLTANAAGAGMFGRAPRNLVGRRIEDLVATPHDASASILWDAIEQESGVRAVGRRPDGTTFPVHVRARELESDGSRVVVLTDLTQIEGITRDLVVAVDRAEQADEAKSRFLATMSHEIRTPLNGIVGMVELLSETELDETQRDYTGTLRKSCNALLSLVNTVLDFSRIEADRMTYADEPFDPVASVHDSLSVFRAEAAKKGLWLRTIVGSDVPLALSGDGDRVRQVVLNLVGNAVKFTRSGGITVVIENLPDHVDGIRIRVADTGVGIAPEDVAAIFDHFTQAGSDTHRTVTGTGLGLAISKRLATDMGGDLTVTSEPGIGSEFRFDVVRPAVAPVDEFDTEPPSEVLVVHRDHTMQASLASAVRRLGSKVVEAGADADVEEILRSGRDIGAVVGDTRSLDRLQPASFAGPNRPRFVEVTGEPTELVERARAGIDAVVSPSGDRQALRRALTGQVVDVAPEVRQDMPTAYSGAVLVADDDEINRKIIRAALMSAGYEFTMVDNGRDALEAVMRNSFDVALLDVRMPEIDGLELTRRIRALDVRQPRIVVMTADTASTTVAAARANGADDILMKPVPPSTVIATIRDVAAGSGRPGPDSPDGGRMTVDVGRVVEFFEDETLALGFLEDFRSHTRLRLEELQGEPDHELIRRVAHQLRNVSSMLGADGVAALATEIDRPEGPPSGWIDGAARLRSALTVMVDSVETHLRSIGA